jgi:hypothetical protein
MSCILLKALLTTFKAPQTSGMKFREDSIRALKYEALVQYHAILLSWGRKFFSMRLFS